MISSASSLNESFQREGLHSYLSSAKSRINIKLFKRTLSTRDLPTLINPFIEEEEEEEEEEVEEE